MNVTSSYNFSNIPWTGGLNRTTNATNTTQQNETTSTDISNTLEEDTLTLNNSNQSENTKLEKNKGLLNKIKHLFTGKDYYKTSTGIKISTDKNTGSVIEMADGTAYVEGAQNAK